VYIAGMKTSTPIFVITSNAIFSLNKLREREWKSGDDRDSL